MFLCRVSLGNVYVASQAEPNLNAPPGRFTSVMGKGNHTNTGIRNNVLNYDEYVVYNGDQVYPLFLIEYKMVLNRCENNVNTEEICYNGDEDEESDGPSVITFSNFLFNALNNDNVDFEDDAESIQNLIIRTREVCENPYSNIATQITRHLLRLLR